MLKYLLIFICFFGALSAKAQKEINLQGTWKVSEVIIDSTSPMASNPTFVNHMKEAMLKFGFNFKADHHMVLTGNLMGHQMPEGIWKYDKADKIITVTEYEHPGKLMTIKVSKDAKGVTFFRLIEALVTLKVVKL